MAYPPLLNSRVPGVQSFKRAHPVPKIVREFSGTCGTRFRDTRKFRCGTRNYENELFNHPAG